MENTLEVGTRIELSELATMFPDEYVFATKVDNNHPDYPNDFWLYYVDHCRFEDREAMRKSLYEKGYKTHWYRTTPNRDFTSVGLIGSVG